MSLLSLINGTLNTIATGLIVFGGILVAEKGDYIGGGILLVAGLVAYVIYEKFPSDSPQV